MIDPNSLSVVTRDSRNNSVFFSKPCEDAGRDAEPSTFETFDSFFAVLADRGYYLRFNVDLMGVSGAVHSVDFLCESPNFGEEKFIGFKLFTDEPNPRDDLSIDESFGLSSEERQVSRVIALTAIAFDTKARACIVVRNKIYNVARDLATSNGVTILEESDGNEKLRQPL